VRAFVEKIMSEHDVIDGDVEGVRRIAEGLLEEKKGELRERMEERERAVRRNKEIEDELEKLRLQRDAEVRVLEKMKGKR
jgi:hypothetical protein